MTTFLAEPAPTLLIPSVPEILTIAVPFALLSFFAVLIVAFIVKRSNKGNAQQASHCQCQCASKKNSTSQA